MTREELRQWFAGWIDDYYDELYLEDDLTPEVAESVLTALRPVSREQVEKVLKSLRYYLETNEEYGVVYIPKFAVEKMIMRLEENKDG